jgi:hypothetical protein
MLLNPHYKGLGLVIQYVGKAFQILDKYHQHV